VENRGASLDQPLGMLAGAHSAFLALHAAGTVVQVHPVLGRLALRHRLEEQPRPFALGIDDRRAPQLGRYLVALGEVFPRREARWWRLSS
jgi:hypothetical protein